MTLTGMKTAPAQVRKLRENIMVKQQRPKMSYVTGADGSPLSLSDLPPSYQKRWVARHKANVVAAVRGGLISLDEVCRRYRLTAEEFLIWQTSVDHFGLPGLRVTKIKNYRHNG
jgi:Protein of unknown function (DUF1153)